jgi:nicotinate phosphoribosyltransferase
MTDLYELTMAAAYFEKGICHHASFELFVRSLPQRRSYLLAAGLAQVLEYLSELHFTEGDIAFLRRQPGFKNVSDAFFDYLSHFRFTGDVWALPEGTPFFANEPILRIQAPIIEAQVLETYLLSIINFETSVATKAARIVGAAQGRAVIEFGARRAHSMESALYGARAAYIGGCVGTSNVEAGALFGIPIYGTAAHSWTMAFDDEMDAFRAYFDVFPEATVLLLDTYDTLEAARKATALGKAIRGVRLDSGETIELSKQVRRILDEAEMTDTKIVVSSDLDEFHITEMLAAGAPVDMFGVGTNLSVSYDAPTLGGVYKLVEQIVDGRAQYKMKLSAEKATYPGRKQVWRRVDEQGNYLYDIVGLMDEEPRAEAFPLLEQAMRNGRLCVQYPTLPEIQQRAKENLQRLPARCRQIQGAEGYEVKYSQKLEELRQRVLADLTSRQDAKTPR